MNLTEKMCDVCGKMKVVPDTDEMNKALDTIYESIDSETFEFVTDEFANKQPCLSCLFEFIAIKERQIVTGEEPE